MGRDSKTVLGDVQVQSVEIGDTEIRPDNVVVTDETGRVDPAILGSGTRNGTKFLRDDGTWIAGATDSFVDPTLEAGDIPIRTTTAGDNRNEAVAGLGATATANSTNFTFIPARAIDGNPASDWYSGSGNRASDWLQVDLGSEKLIDRFRLRQASPSPASESCTAYKIQSGATDQGPWFDQHLVSTGSVVVDTGVIALDSGPITARYWRARGVAPSDSGDFHFGWDVHDFELWSPVAAGDAIQRLPIGEEGQILAVVGGIPTWVNIEDVLP